MNIDEIINEGFKLFGKFKDVTTKNATRSKDKAHLLYAFVIDSDVKYIGRTELSLYKAMMRHEVGSVSQKTNHRVSGEIKAIHAKDKDVEVYILICPKDSNLDEKKKTILKEETLPWARR